MTLLEAERGPFIYRKFFPWPGDEGQGVGGFPMLSLKLRQGGARPQNTQAVKARHARSKVIRSLTNDYARGWRVNGPIGQRSADLP